MKVRKALSLVLLLVLALTLIPSAIAGSSAVVPVQAQQGTIKWQWKTESDVAICRTPAIGPDGNIYVTAGVGGMSYRWVAERLFCISPQGSPLWKSQELDHFAAGDPVIGSDGTIYVVGYYKLYAFNPNGTLKWEWTTPEDGDPYPHAQICGVTLGQDGTIYTSHCGAGSYHRHLFALNPDGRMKWARDLFADPNIGSVSRLTVGRDGVLYGQCSYFIYAFNPDNGAILWQSVGLETTTSGGLAIGSDGTIYIPGSMQGLIAMNSDGTIRWEWKEPISHWLGFPAIGSDGTIYGTSNGLHALTSDGQWKWTAASGGGGHSTAIASDGTIYSTLFHSHIGGRFTAVNPDGSIKWKLEIPSWGGLPAIGSDGTIYVTGGSKPGVLTAVYGSYGVIPPPPGKFKECVGDQPYLYVEDRVMGKEKTVEIPIMMCNAKELANMDLDWSYDASVLKIIGVTKGSLNKEALFDWNEVSTGKLKISFASSKGVTGSGSIAVMKFKVIGNPGDTSTLTGTVTTASKTDGSKLSVGANPGKFTVGSSPVKGDCDGDGELTVKDALAALQMSVEKRAVDMCYDYDDDGKVNSADAREMLKAIVGKE